jgi:hypothetical protein
LIVGLTVTKNGDICRAINAAPPALRLARNCAA